MTTATTIAAVQTTRCKSFPYCTAEIPSNLLFCGPCWKEAPTAMAHNLDRRRHRGQTMAQNPDFKALVVRTAEAIKVRRIGEANWDRHVRAMQSEKEKPRL